VAFFCGSGGVVGVEREKKKERMKKKGDRATRLPSVFLRWGKCLSSFSLSFDLSLSLFHAFLALQTEPGTKLHLFSYLADESVGVFGVARGAAGLLMVGSREGRRRRGGQSSRCRRRRCSCREPRGEPPAQEEASRCGGERHGLVLLVSKGEGTSVSLASKSKREAEREREREHKK
jgi:hypothetical protein